MSGELQLTAQRVDEIVKDCLFENREDITDENSVKAHGAMATFIFNKEKIAERQEEIFGLLSCLPDAFTNPAKGGHSFLAACMDKQDRQWGEHTNIEALLCLGLASGQVQYCAPRELWGILPGGMPYFRVVEKTDG